MYFLIFHTFTSLPILQLKLKMNMYFLLFLEEIEGIGFLFIHHAPFLSLTYSCIIASRFHAFPKKFLTLSPLFVIKKAKQQFGNSYWQTATVAIAWDLLDGDVSAWKNSGKISFSISWHLSFLALINLRLEQEIQVKPSGPFYFDQSHCVSHGSQPKSQTTWHSQNL